MRKILFLIAAAVLFCRPLAAQPAAALEDKLKWTQKKHEACKVSMKLGAPDRSLRDMLEANLALYEAESDLKKAKKEAAKKDPLPQEQILKKLESLQNQIDTLRNELQRIPK